MSRLLALVMDGAMCGIMNHLQWRLRHDACTPEQLEAYLRVGDSLTREHFYATPSQSVIPAPCNPAPVTTLEWPSPHPSGHAENDAARALWFVGPHGPAAPTALVLHALMSASDTGYRRLAQWFHQRGWNMVFPHLPFHYSRKPLGHANGALAITANLPRNAETLRQAVIEQRQLLAFLRAQGATDFGVLGTSYGGWNAALLSFVEPDFRFLSLVQPIIDPEHAIWENPSAAALRNALRRRGIQAGDSRRHAHLSSPMHGTPLTPAHRISIIAGRYDTVAPARPLRALAAEWCGAHYIEVRQGHFGYTALEAAKRHIDGLITFRQS